MELIWPMSSAHQSLTEAGRTADLELVTMDQARRMPGADFGKVSLSQRETQVLRLLAEDKSRQEIADILALSKCTIEFHIRNMRDKLDARSTVGVIMWGVRAGIIPLSL